MKTAKERQLMIVSILVDRGHETLQNLANELETSVTTIRRDVDYLSGIIPLTGQRGNGGGIVLAESYRRLFIGMTYEQRKLLIKVSETLSPEDSELMMSVVRDFSGFS